MVGLPDNASAALFALAANDPTISLVSVTREGEAFAIAAGLWIGGKTPVVVIQNTGLLESGDSLRGTVARMGVPLLTLVSCRGFATLQRVERDGTDWPEARDILRRADLDSVAFLSEPTLDAWNIPHVRYEGDADVPNCEMMWQLSVKMERPTALLVTVPLQ